MLNPEPTADFDLCHLAQQKAHRKRRNKLQRQAKAATGLTPRPEKHFQAIRQPTERQLTGLHFEKRAEALLCDQGYEILASRIRCRAGEIDLVAKDGVMLVFVEVRWRNRTDFGGAVASVDSKKQTRLIRTAMRYLPALARIHFAGKTPICRFDIIGFEPGRTSWLKNTIQDHLSMR